MKSLENTANIAIRDNGRTTGRTRNASEGDSADAELAALVAAWPTLSEPIRTAIRAIVGTFTNLEGMTR